MQNPAVKRGFVCVGCAWELALPTPLVFPPPACLPRGKLEDTNVGFDHLSVITSYRIFPETFSLASFGIIAVLSGNRPLNLQWTPALVL